MPTSPTIKSYLDAFACIGEQECVVIPFPLMLNTPTFVSQEAATAQCHPPGPASAQPMMAGKHLSVLESISPTMLSMSHSM